ncbi:DUF3140 domain-containing protein [Thermobifida fusca]|jgi:hypothetical protein|uniref:DUF3140 domain-containing protein n=2 Tax=Thermobifida fusca TaxID=2021 RepID=A0A9P2TBV7_THEFU|nr:MULTISPECIES: DUF3140 domain-containing protein [Thermobifida]AAZ54929.1 conserved hypothetical protein [Thermobifida fusca YX]EOR72043.1 hypothetical protein TM51_04838 [Thermobifida fusca TM51]MBO2531082.1 DUF3140 domain-containing protein [Thermobifida sp.]MDD6791082.1 DUF3140 domain-containing protein [Thermobifida fusca]PPS91817.1 hypothetical protein BH05_13060 [Thermobifida fusca]
MAQHRLSEDALDRLWTRFHELVNMNGNELRSWLLTEASNPEGFTSHPSLNIDEEGRKIIHVLTKRRTDLTDEDVDTMQTVVDEVSLLLQNPRPDDDEWRHALMTLGHDPLKPTSPRPGEDPELSG